MPVQVARKLRYYLNFWLAKIFCDDAWYSKNTIQVIRISYNNKITFCVIYLSIICARRLSLPAIVNCKVNLLIVFTAFIVITKVYALLNIHKINNT